MAFVTRYGNAISENQWRMVDQAECVWSTIPGTHVSIQLRQGIPTRILVEFLARFNQRIEPLRDADTAGWTPTNAVATSNHMAGTACDANWNSHPFHVRNTFGDKRSELEALLAEFDGAVWWGGWWTQPVDEMHFQLNWPEDDPRYGPVLEKLDHTPHLAGAGLTAETLSQAMGSSLSLERYAELLPAVQDCLVRCECNTLNRVAMWMAQVGHESGGLQWMEEIADGSEYEGRRDLGNTQPGDGRRFKGRGPIQVTGRHNYSTLSAWACGQGIVPTPTYFVDHPEELASDTYGFVGVIWYWTVARDMNGYADDGDINGATYAVNGGDHGLADRTQRWNRCLAMGYDHLSVIPGSTSHEGFLMALSDAQQQEIYDALCGQRVSRSPLHKPGEGTIGNIEDLEANTDGSVHILVQYLLGVILRSPKTLEELRAVAASTDPNQEGGRQIAQAMLNLIEIRDRAPGPNVVVAQAPISPPASPVAPQEVPSVQSLNTSPPAGGTLGDDFGKLHGQLSSLTDALGELSSAFLGRK